MLYTIDGVLILTGFIGHFSAQHVITLYKLVEVLESYPHKRLWKPVCLYVCEILKIPLCPDKRVADGGNTVSLTRRPPLYSPEILFISVTGINFC
jgi:hypothetical protein